MKVVAFVGSRANWGRLKSLCKELTDRNHDLTVILGASGYKLDIPYKNIVLPNLLENNDCMSMAVTTGLLTTQIAPFLNEIKPDVVIIHGDRHECLGVAIAASYMNIPLCQTEGGESTGTIDDKVRYSITALADYHFPVTELSAYRLGEIKGLSEHDISWCSKPAKMYFKQGNIYRVGSTAFDGLQYIKEMGNYAVILHHPNTTDPEDITPLIEAVEELDIPKIWVNPNVDAGSKAILKKIHQLKKVVFMKDLSPEQYIDLISQCRVLIGNTSSMIKEGSYLGIPAVCVGNRQNGRETDTNVIRVPMDKDSILKTVGEQLKHGRYEQSFKFGDGQAAKKIVDVLEEVL